MALTLAEKIIQEHIVSGTLSFEKGKSTERGTDLAIKILRGLYAQALKTEVF